VSEGERERYPARADEYECVMLELVISNVVLGEPSVELRRRLAEVVQGSGATDAPAGAIQHSLLGLRSDS